MSKVRAMGNPSDDAIKRACAPMLYFSHDADAMSDSKLKRLKRRCGWDGIGRWWHVCELLASSNGHTLSFGTDEDIGILGDDLDMTDDEATDFVATLADVGLIDCDLIGDGIISSKRMAENALRFGIKRASGAKGGKVSQDKTSNA